MEKIDKIIELLEKKSLTDDDRKILHYFSESDEEIKSFISVYRGLISSFSRSTHISADLLSSFVLHEMGDGSEDKIIHLIRNKIKVHLDECSYCRDEHKLLINYYNDVKEHVNKTVVRNIYHSAEKVRSTSSLPVFLKQLKFKYVYLTLVILLAGYIGLFVVSSSLTPYYQRNIFSQGEDDFYMTRGRTSVLFQQGLNAIEKGDYDNAIRYLSDDIREHKNDKSIFYTYYIIGITYLKAAEQNYLGLFKSYDKEKVNLAIANFKGSIDQNYSGDYENLKLDSYYYIGRAFLLIDIRDSAISNLQKVVDGKGKYSKESAELIKQIGKN